MSKNQTWHQRWLPEIYSFVFVFVNRYITEINKEYVLWEVCREFPKYYPFTQKAVRMLGLMFSGKWVRTCHFCQEAILSPTEHMLLFCRKTNRFREILLRRLILKFGLKFFSDFISEPPNSQLEMLFSGCSKILKDKTDVTDSAKIFVAALGKIHSQTDWGTVI